MTFNQIIDKINKTFKSCKTKNHINIANKYSYMLVYYFYKNPDYFFGFTNEANEIFNYIDSQMTVFSEKLC